MPMHHINELYQTLEQHGWQVEADWDTRDHSRYAAIWHIRRRSGQSLTLLFDSFDGSRDTPPIEHSYACWLENGKPSLYIPRHGKTKGWQRELADFVAQLETVVLSDSNQ